MEKIRNLFIIALVFLIAVFVSSRFKKEAEDEKFISKAVYLYNLTDDKEVLSKNENERLPMASLTKIMTVRVALKHITDLAATAPVDTDAYHRAIDMNASMAGFRGGEATSYRDLLYATMLRSAGEAADSLAINISGSMDNYVAMMNQEAKDLGLKNTSYANADGMDDPGNYQSAKDCAMLIKDSLEDGDFRAIFTKRDFVTRPTLDHPDGVYLESTVFSHLKKYNQNGFEIIGGKSGTTDKAGLCWATLAEKNGKEYILVVMGVPYDNIDNLNDGHIEETLRIYESIGD